MRIPDNNWQTIEFSELKLDVGLQVNPELERKLELRSKLELEPAPELVVYSPTSFKGNLSTDQNWN